jgi:hypothetical protein
VKWVFGAAAVRLGIGGVFVERLTQAPRAPRMTAIETSGMYLLAGLAGTGAWMIGDTVWRFGDLDGLRGAAAGERATGTAGLAFLFLTDQRSQVSAAFMRCFPLASRPFAHSSAAAGPRARASFISCVMSATCFL